jgi:hypothetical protein
MFLYLVHMGLKELVPDLCLSLPDIVKRSLNHLLKDYQRVNKLQPLSIASNKETTIPWWVFINGSLLLTMGKTNKLVCQTLKPIYAGMEITLPLLLLALALGAKTVSAQFALAPITY